jgi:PAS domain-containing protein
MDFAQISKIVSENYDKGILGAISIWVTKKVYAFIKPRYKKFKEFSHSVDRILQLQLDVDLIEEENFILRSTLVSVVKTAIYPMYMLDKNNDLILVNDAWLQVTGFNNPENAYATGYFKAIHPDDLKEMHEIADERKGASTPASGNVKFKNLITHNITQWEYRTEAIKNSKGEIINYIGSLKTILITLKK